MARVLESKRSARVFYKVIERPVTRWYIALTVASEVVTEHAESFLQYRHDPIPQMQIAAEPVNQDYTRGLVCTAPGLNGVRVVHKVQGSPSRILPALKAVSSVKFLKIDYVWLRTFGERS